MPVDFPLAGGWTALTLVFSDADRTLRFPNPNTNQLVYNTGTGAIQRWTGAVWANEVPFAGGALPQTFNALATMAAGVALSGTGAAAGYQDYVTLNSARQGGQAGYALYGTNPTGGSDVRVYNDGSGNYIVAIAGIPVWQIDVAGNAYMLKTGATFFPETGAHQNVDGWSIANPTNGASNVQLTRSPSQWAGCRAGWITGVLIRAAGPMTGGAGVIATMTVFKNGVATSITTSVTAGQQANATTYLAPQGGAIQFAAGDVLDLRLTTAASWTYTSGTVFGTVEVLA